MKNTWTKYQRLALDASCIGFASRGADSYPYFCTPVGARILGWAWMNVFILALLCLCYFRMFSRNIQARYAENEKFMRWWRPVSNRIRGAQGRFADRKTHCYFKCPECHALLRLPRKVGEVTVTCGKCKHSFKKKA